MTPELRLSIIGTTSWQLKQGCLQQPCLRYLFNARENIDVFRLLLTHPTIRANEEDIGCVFRSAVIEGYVTHLQLLLDYGINLSQFRRPDDIETALLFKRYAMVEFLRLYVS